jgi:hypothetical protein
MCALYHYHIITKHRRVTDIRRVETAPRHQSVVKVSQGRWLARLLRALDAEPTTRRGSARDRGHDNDDLATPASKCDARRLFGRRNEKGRRLGGWCGTAGRIISARARGSLARFLRGRPKEWPPRRVYSPRPRISNRRGDSWPLLLPGKGLMPPPHQTPKKQ